MPPDVLLGPGRGEDAALVKMGGETWAVASDPITYTSSDAGRLAVIVNANDVAVCGARPRFFTAVVLLKPGAVKDEVVEVLERITYTAGSMGIALIGGHTEVTPGLPHTVIAGTMLGRVEHRPITTRGLQEGDWVGMTRWAGLEGTVLLGELEGDWLSVVPEALAAAAVPEVTALHDVTEGGVGEALFELAEASGLGLEVDRGKIPILEETRKICARWNMDPLGLIGSGALLIGCAEHGKARLEKALKDTPFAWIARAGKGPPSTGLPRFERDEILKAMKEKKA
jgi:hydrogenase maturation factor